MEPHVTTKNRASYHIYIYMSIYTYIYICIYNTLVYILDKVLYFPNQEYTFFAGWFYVMSTIFLRLLQSTHVQQMEIASTENAQEDNLDFQQI